MSVVDVDADMSYYPSHGFTSVPCRPGLTVPLDPVTTAATTVSTTADYRGPPGPPGPQVSCQSALLHRLHRRLLSQQIAQRRRSTTFRPIRRCVRCSNPDPSSIPSVHNTTESHQLDVKPCQGRGVLGVKISPKITCETLLRGI